MKISIIIPVHNRKAHTFNILVQLHEQLNKGQYQENINILVVDDGSKDGTQEMIEVNFPDVYLLKGDGSLWWTGAITKGMKYALDLFKSDYIVWMNDDLYITDIFLHNLMKICNKYQYQQTVVGGIVRDKNYSNWVVYSGIKDGQRVNDINYFSLNQEIKVNELNGNIVVIPRKVIDKIGFPDVARFTQYGGDFEYTARANSFGFSVILSSELQAYTEFTSRDIIRHMSPWMQWYLQPHKSQRREIIKGLTSLKTHYNIWFFVNMSNIQSQQVPRWKYMWCYWKRIIRLMITDLMPKKYMDSRVADYLSYLNTPSEIIQQISRVGITDH